MKLYKLTDAEGRTKGETQWGENVTHSVTGKPKLCSSTVLHAYRSAALHPSGLIATEQWMNTN